MAFRALPCMTLSGLLALSPALAFAADPGTPMIDRLRAYLIYEDTGKLSKNIAKREDQIVANDENGTSVQVLVDIVLTARPNQSFESNPTLYVVARSQAADAGAPPMIDTGFPLNFIGSTGEQIRTIVVDANCNGFDLEAYVMDGDKRTSELKKSFSITCGD